MDNSKTHYEDRILELEKNFFQCKYLQDKEYIADIFDDDYFEMGKSRKRYNKQDAIAALSSIDEDRSIEIFDFECNQIDSNVYLVHYTTRESGIDAYRTSIWRNTNGKLRIIFHQATAFSQ